MIRIDITKTVIRRRTYNTTERREKDKRSNNGLQSTTQTIKIKQ
jgi:hypothetical protein